MQVNRIHCGDVLDWLPTVTERSVQCCVTSPPYWGLRDYGLEPTDWPEVRYEPMPGIKAILTVAPQRCCLGLEANPWAFTGHLVHVFRGVVQALRTDGTLWLNMGDRYLNGTNDPKSFRRDKATVNVVGKRPPPGLKPKDLLGMPWRVALALQADGWWLRQDIIWAKPNPMPESCTDRCTKAHEYLFLMTRAPRYYYDAEAIREITGNELSWEEYGKRTAPGMTWPSGMSDGKYAGSHKHDGGRSHPAGRNKRDVWTVAPHSFPGAHFATFPPKLVEPCILAGTSERGACPACGASWVREVEKSEQKNETFKGSRFDAGKTAARDGGDRTQGGNRFASKTTGWRPGCECDAGEPVPCIVMDPFMGSGTTAMVARKHGRDYIGYEKSPEYHAMAEARIKAVCGLPLFDECEEEEP